MSTIEESIKQLLSAQEDAKRWTTGPIILIVATSKTDDRPISINLSATIGHNKQAPRAPKRDDTTCYWLPSFFNKNNHDFREQYIHPLFVNAARNAGFRVHAEYVKCNQSIRLSCLKGRYHNEKKSKEYTGKRTRNVKNPPLPPIPRQRKTQKVLKSGSALKSEEDEGDDDDKESHTCKVAWSIYWDEYSQRWFLRRNYRAVVYTTPATRIPYHKMSVCNQNLCQRKN